MYTCLVAFVIMCLSGALTALACMQAVSAGIRPQMDRTQGAGAPAVRAAVLSVAQQQKLAACTALLREVAGVYGFALHLNPEVGEATPGWSNSHKEQPAIYKCRWGIHWRNRVCTARAEG